MHTHATNWGKWSLNVKPSKPVSHLPATISMVVHHELEEILISCYGDVDFAMLRNSLRE